MTRRPAAIGALTMALAVTVSCASDPASTPTRAVPTDTAQPSPAATIKSRSWQEVRVHCKKDQNAQEFLIAVDAGTRIADLASDFAIADCYGDTMQQKAVNISSSLANQGGVEPDSLAPSADHQIAPGIYKLFLRPDVLGEAAGGATDLFLVTPTPLSPIATPTQAPTQQVNCTETVEYLLSKVPSAFESVEDGIEWCNECTSRNGIPTLSYDIGPFCNLRASDAGKPCTDSDQCEGVCLAESEASKSGTCSDTETVLGCVFEMTDGQSLGICFD